MKYNKVLLSLAQSEIENVILRMPPRFASLQFYDLFVSAFRDRYETFLRIYTRRGHDRPHAIQIANREMMHTVKNCFPHLVRKIGDCPNPKGGVISNWHRIG